MNKRLTDENDELLQSLTKRLLFSTNRPEESCLNAVNSANSILIENLTKENNLLRDELTGISCLYLMMKIEALIKKIE